MLKLAKIFDSDLYLVPYHPSYKEFERMKAHKKNPKVKDFPLLPTSLKTILASLENKYMKLSLNLPNYDLVFIATSSGVFSAIENHPNVCYYQGLPSFQSDQQREFLMEKYGFLYKLWSKYESSLFKRAASHVDHWIVNSKTTKTVVRNRYGRNADIVYPPVNVERFEWKEPKKYFLSVQGLSSIKRVEWQVEAFNPLSEKLKIVGKGPEEKKLKNIANENIEFLGRVSDEELVELYSRCKAVIQTNPHEAFGLVPVEAMASGKPAICPNAGGFRETIVDGKTGILFNEPYVENLRRKVREFDSSMFDHRKCQERAKKFSEEKFETEIREKVHSIH